MICCFSLVPFHHCSILSNKVSQASEQQTGIISLWGLLRPSSWPKSWDMEQEKEEEEGTCSSTTVLTNSAQWNRTCYHCLVSWILHNTKPRMMESSANVHCLTNQSRIRSSLWVAWVDVRCHSSTKSTREVSPSIHSYVLKGEHMAFFTRSPSLIFPVQWELVGNGCYLVDSSHSIKAFYSTELWKCVSPMLSSCWNHTK